jgi:chloride channel protein, CIC family
VAGAVTGLTGACFRLVLREADSSRVDVMSQLRPLGAAGVLIAMLIVAACAALARGLVRLAPEAGGSGVQRVEAVMRGEARPASSRVLPVKFVGGALALGAGMVLGREGPTVQMGAVIGDWFAKQARLSTVDLRRLQAATAGAGLAVAFSAPVGGAVFTFEEVARSTTTRLIVVSLSACASAIAVAWLILGSAPVFNVIALAHPTWGTAAPFVVFGALLGALGVAYNRLMVVFLDLADRYARVPPEVSAGVIGGTVGFCLFIDDNLVGGGDVLNQRVLTHTDVTMALAAILGLRACLGPLCYAAGTPGGIFAPLLLVGAVGGTLFADTANHLWPGAGLDPVAFAIVGMSTFFTAVVRAPLTGIVLIMEMTATTSQAVPMLGAAASAVLVATVLKGEPIYDTLRLRMLRTHAADASSECAERSRTVADALQHDRSVPEPGARR